ncbi:AAA family ATPase [Pedobacter terrae]|uniref:AAA family ATPase n=1 Tax=Pedobacter terrae TaxID=405671 RepID=UPI002FFD511B
MFKKSLKAYHQILDMNSDSIAFFDRGLPDTLCYMKMENIPVTEKYYETMKATMYNRKVIILPPSAEIYETDMERKQSWNEAILTYRKMKETYIELGYDVITVPLGSVESRCAFILKSV